MATDKVAIIVIIAIVIPITGNADKRSYEAVMMEEETMIDDKTTVKERPRNESSASEEVRLAKDRVRGRERPLKGTEASWPPPNHSAAKRPHAHPAVETADTHATMKSTSGHSAVKAAAAHSTVEATAAHSATSFSRQGGGHYAKTKHCGGKEHFQFATS
jgi:hypothetical protein